MRKSLFIGLIAIPGIIGCTQKQEIDTQENGLSLFARTESPAETKTVVEEGVHVFWEPGDEIAVFMGEQSAKFTTDITAATGTATFKGTFGDATWPEDLDLWAVYPFSEDAVFDGETITTTLPSEQVAREGSFGKDMNLAIAHSNSSTLQFYNVGGGIRFSVTEEGIKKVMFEGLSGEIISGKVKIGMDENGKPEVREVTGGSQFITLLPPDGSETFQKDTWYYIVAIPGSLEGGYKLRFYKDSDYARKVSEKAVVIKRSIFGNVEKADDGIEYEATMTHFPKTDEEWEASVALTESTSDVIGHMVESYIDSQIDISVLLEGTKNVEGILTVRVNTDNSAMMVRQKDSVWINYLLFDSSYLQRRSSIQPTLASSNSVRTRSDAEAILSRRTAAMVSPQKEAINKNNAYISKSKKALVLAPFQEEFEEPLQKWEDALKTRFAEVTVLPDKKATIDCFTDEYLSQFDFILINTHGVIGYYEYEYGIVDGLTFEGFGLTTATRYSAKEAKRLIEEEGFGPEDLFVTWHDWKRYFCMTSHSLKNKMLDNPVVILSACNSAYRKDDFTDYDAKESMMGAFLINGARAVIGTKCSMYDVATGVFDEMMIRYMVNGLTFQDAMTYIIKSEKTQRAVDALYQLYPDSEYSGLNIPHDYTIQINKYTNDHPYFLLFDPFPYELNANIDGSDVICSWRCNLESFTIPWHDSIASCQDGHYWERKNYSFSVLYDVYSNNGELIKSDISIESMTWPPTVPRDNNWYVVAKIMEGDTVIASYQSTEGHFTISDGNLDDIPGHNI